MSNWRNCARHCPCGSDGTSMVIVSYYCMSPHTHGPEGFDRCPGCLAEGFQSGEIVIDFTKVNNG